MAQPFTQLSLPADPKEPVPCALQRLSAEELAAALAADKRVPACHSLRCLRASDARVLARRAGGACGRIVVVDARDAVRGSAREGPAQHVWRCMMACANVRRAQDRSDGHVAGARHVGTQAVWLRDEGVGGAVDQARSRAGPNV
jgi:hypothetical protein